jgi:hypothetical protein
MAAKAAIPRQKSFWKNGPTALFKSKTEGLQFNKVDNPAVTFTNPAFRAPSNTYGLVGPSHGPDYLKVFS